MKSTSFALAVIIGLSVARALAQPTLDRLEQGLRSAPLTLGESGYLGVIADDRQDQGAGVRVIEVVAGGPAASGGVDAGDLITSINGRPIRSMDDMGRILQRLSVGAKLNITVNRQATVRQIDVVLGRRTQTGPVGRPAGELPTPAAPTAEVAAPQGPHLGVRTVPVSETVQKQNGMPIASGATVISVTVGSPADRAGVPLGAVIVALDSEPIGTPEELAAAVRGAGPREVELMYLNRGQEVRKRILLSADAMPADSPKLELRSRPLDGPALGEPSVPRLIDPAENARTAALEARIRELEERIEKLEAALAGDKE